MDRDACATGDAADHERAVHAMCTVLGKAESKSSVATLVAAALTAAHELMERRAPGARRNLPLVHLFVELAKDREFVALAESLASDALAHIDAASSGDPVVRVRREPTPMRTGRALMQQYGKQKRIKALKKMATDKLCAMGAACPTTRCADEAATSASESVVDALFAASPAPQRASWH